MKMFLWNRVEDLTQSYHSEGGLVVIASDLGEARGLLRLCTSEDPYEEAMPKECEAFTREPDHEWDIQASEPRVFAFPDAGCC